MWDPSAATGSAARAYCVFQAYLGCTPKSSEMPLAELHDVLNDMSPLAVAEIEGVGASSDRDVAREVDPARWQVRDEFTEGVELIEVETGDGAADMDA